MMNKSKPFLSKLKLHQQVIILLITMFLLGIMLSGITLYNILMNNAQRQISDQSSMALRTLMSVREYTETQIRPELNSRLKDEFLALTIPSYAATQVFNLVSDDPEWQNYAYKEAALNPTNPLDKADQFETSIIENYRKNKNLPLPLTGYTSSISGNEKLFYVARPIEIKQASCLECHGLPEDAPASMVSRYPQGGGFGWRLNEIIGTQILYVPAGTIFQRTKQQFFTVMGILLLVFLLTLFLLNVWLSRFITNPLKKITSVAKALSLGETTELELEVKHNSSQEIGSLAKAFNRMKNSLLLAMERLENPNM